MTAATTWTDTVMATLVGSLIAVGPELGHFALMFFGAFIGTMHSVSKTDFDHSHFRAAWYMLRWIGTALVLTHATSTAIVHYTGIPADRWPGVVAFLITFLADKWPEWVTSLLDNFFKSRMKQGE